eukprot:13711267-Alexandrium_andersonii.AAC.1
MAAATGTVAQLPRGTMAPPSFLMVLLRRFPWPPPGQGALHVQYFPVACAVGSEWHMQWPRMHVRGCSAQ